jgi:hypothetical protein
VARLARQIRRCSINKMFAILRLSSRMTKAVWLGVPSLVSVLVLATACFGGSSTPAAPSISATDIKTTSASSTASNVPTARSSSLPAQSDTPPTTTQASPVPTILSGVVSVDQNMNGRALTLALGTRLVLSLNSTYWVISPLSSSGILALADGPHVSSLPIGPDCPVPGLGCGTVSVAYDAIGVGEAEVGAMRVSCGEALACTPEQATFGISVTVTAY